MKREAHHIRQWICLLIFSMFGFAQTDPVDTHSAEVSVVLTSKVDIKHVPLNQTVQFTVQISWHGDPGRIEIRDIEEPILSNFEITGTASANHVVAGTGGSRAVKEIIYALKPSNLGMSYIESVGLSYEDQSTGETYLLKTERIGVEVLPPVKEAESSGGVNWIWFLCGVIIIGGVTAFILFRRHHCADEEENESVMLEEDFLNELKSGISLSDSNRRDAISALSKLFRHYLSEKFNIPARESTTEDLLKILNASGIDEALIRKSDQLFKQADLILFSGQEVDQAKLDSAYTTVETVLESQLAKVKDSLQTNAHQKTKKLFRKNG